MKGNLKQALENANMMYTQLAEIADGIVKNSTSEIDEILRTADRVKDLTDSQMRNLIVLLSMKSYNFSEAKDHAALRLECAESLRKEAHAKVLLSTEGTAGVRENTAIQETADEIMVAAIYQIVASMLKTKLDEVHRIVDALKSALMSRMQEAKLASMLNNRAAYED